MDWKNTQKLLDKFKYPLLVLGIGVLLMLLPGSVRSPTGDTKQEESFARILSSADGVGESRIAISDSGIVVVCEGADDPAVKLSLLQAIRSYTGFSSDHITILKMTGHGRGG